MPSRMDLRKDVEHLTDKLYDKEDPVKGVILIYVTEDGILESTFNGLNYIEVLGALEMAKENAHLVAKEDGEEIK